MLWSAVVTDGLPRAAGLYTGARCGGGGRGQRALLPNATPPHFDSNLVTYVPTSLKFSEIWEVSSRLNKRKVNCTYMVKLSVSFRLTFQVYFPESARDTAVVYQ